MDGEYETDYISCVLWDAIAKNAAEYCKKGNIVGVRGRIEAGMYEDEKTKEKKFRQEIIAEKITFLSSKSENE